MEDAEILQLLAARSERALAEISARYGAQCMRLAKRILDSPEDAEECMSDVYLCVWQRIPPETPENLAAYLVTLTRNTALNRLKFNNRQCRGSGQTAAVLEELADCIPDTHTVEAELDRRTFAAHMNRFLATLPDETRRIFVQRYWHMQSCRAIADAFGISEGKVRVTLSRTRKKCRQFFEKEELL